MNKKTITILIGTIAIIGVLVFVFTKDGKQNEITPVKVEAPIEEVPAKVEGVEKIEGWQTFRSEELGFEVQYPEGWFVKEYFDDQIVSFGPGWSRPGGGLWSVLIDISDNTPEMEIDNFILDQNESHVADRSSIKNINISGYPAISIESLTRGEDYFRPATRIFVTKNGKTSLIFEDEAATLEYNPDKDNGETFKRFYESFRFLD